MKDIIIVMLSKRRAFYIESVNAFVLLNLESVTLPCVF